MTPEQLLITGILLATVALFLWGRWRHDMVAAGALLACVVVGLVPAGEAFAGFGHPAVITVACVLVLSHALQHSGAVDILVRRVIPTASGPTLTIAALTASAALLSGFMNNVGALALLMPAAIQVASRQGIPPGKVLMPVAFGSILGGMTTMIGTPPNLIVSGFRAETGAGAFGMFDFTPVGLSVAAAGVLFVALVGWKLVPARERAGAESFETGAYLTEARVPEGSKAVGMRLHEVEKALEESEGQVVGLIRNEQRMTAPGARQVIQAGDIVVVEADAEALAGALSAVGMKLEEAKPNHDKHDKHDKQIDADSASAGKKAGDEKADAADEIVLTELVVMPRSELVGRSAHAVQLRSRYGINLLAVSRQGARSMSRLRTMEFRAGDVLLLQGYSESLGEFASDSGGVPLAERAVRVPDARRALSASAVMLCAVALAAFGVLPAAVAFLAGVLATMVLRTIPIRSVYKAVDWPVIVLIAALIPVAGAMDSTGAADYIARALLDNVARGHAVVGLGLILAATMAMTDLMNNAATAAVMCPVALGAAAYLDANPDTFLMAVAIGASSAFLTPIGHQNNTLILGPGGFRFGDYWRLGLPVEILVVSVSLPVLILVWPL